jgi:hypothetical protein
VIVDRRGHCRNRRRSRHDRRRRGGSWCGRDPQLRPATRSAPASAWASGSSMLPAPVRREMLLLARGEAEAASTELDAAGFRPIRQPARDRPALPQPLTGRRSPTRPLATAAAVRASQPHRGRTGLRWIGTPAAPSGAVFYEQVRAPSPARLLSAHSETRPAVARIPCGHGCRGATGRPACRSVTYCCSTPLGAAWPSTLRWLLRKDSGSAGVLAGPAQG